MKKIIKLMALLIVWGGILPAAAGYGIMFLWNWLLPPVLGCAAITWLQGVGLFLLGQLLSAGFVIGIFIFGGLSHAITHHHMHHSHWHDMTEEEQREYFERRRQWHEMARTFKNRSKSKRHCAECNGERGCAGCPKRARNDEKE